MFSSEIYGYNKNEVDKFISNLKAEHEKALMEEKLKVLEAEKKVLETKNKAQEIENRSKNIFSLLIFRKTSIIFNIKFLSIEENLCLILIWLILILVFL